MSAGKYNISAEQGATFKRVLIWKDSVGTPIDITGFTSKMQVRAGYGLDVLLDLSTANGKIIIIASVNGKFSINETATNMSALKAGVYKYDIEMTNGAEVTRILEGSFTVSEEITQ